MATSTNTFLSRSVLGRFVEKSRVDHDEHGDRRYLQMTIPDYTSPPTQLAIDATPEAYRSDAAIELAREADANNECGNDSSNTCQIPFIPNESQFDSESQIGVVLYGGGLVDPRSYSPIAKIMAERYGIPVVIPIFHQDVAFSPSCYTGRIEVARSQLDYVEKWVLVGHSLGGLGAANDLWSIHEGNQTSTSLDDIAGLVMLAADINPETGCGPVDFSASGIPMAAVTGSEDLILNMTRYDSNRRRFANGTTFFIDILGGNHAQFGSYDDSERKDILDQVDGIATIPETVQFDLIASAIYHVASRAGLPLPNRVELSAAVANDGMPTPTPAPAPTTTTSGASSFGTLERTTTLLWIVMLCRWLRLRL